RPGSALTYGPCLPLGCFLLRGSIMGSNEEGASSEGRESLGSLSGSTPTDRSGTPTPSNMGVSHGKKRDVPSFPDGSEAHQSSSGFESSSAPRTPQTVEQHRAPSLQSEEDEEEEEEEEGSNLIRPQKPLSPLKASKSHRELHKELRMTHTRKVLREEKSELQRALEKRRWEQRIKASRDQDEETKKRSPLYQELTKRHQRLEMLEGERRQQQEGPEFLRVRERLRKIPVLDLGE
ncbi:Protein FAM107A, partial [Takifugu flavidus]